MKKTDKLKVKQILNIPYLINEKNFSVGKVAEKYKVTWQAVWYWVSRFKKEGLKINTRLKGQVGKKIINY